MLGKCGLKSTTRGKRIFLSLIFGTRRPSLDKVGFSLVKLFLNHLGVVAPMYKIVLIPFTTFFNFFICGTISANSSISGCTIENLMVGYNELMKSVKSSKLVVPWVHNSKMSSLYLHDKSGLISPDLAGVTTRVLWAHGSAMSLEEMFALKVGTIML